MVFCKCFQREAVSIRTWLQSDTMRVQLESLERWNGPKKLLQLLFPEDKTPSVTLLHSFWPHLINTPAWAQNMWIIHVKPNFKEKKSLRHLIIIKSQRTHRKIHKSPEYLLFPKMLAVHLPHLCSSLDTILCSVRNGNFSSLHQGRARAVQGQKWVLLCSTCSWAQRGQSYTAGWNYGLRPSWTAQCSPCARWSWQCWDMDSIWWGVPTRHPLLGYCNRKSKQKTWPPLPSP